MRKVVFLVLTLVMFSLFAMPAFAQGGSDAAASGGTNWVAITSGFAMAFARAVGEYGSVVFISGNMPMRTEITPLLIITKLEQYDYAGATAIAVVMLVASFALLLTINLLQAWSGGRLQSKSSATSVDLALSEA
jgi:hypothetical protein